MATFIATLGNIINGAVKGCDRASTAHNVITADRFADIIRIDLLLGPRPLILDRKRWSNVQINELQWIPDSRAKV